MIAKVASNRTARAWVYREQLREVLDCKQINVVTAMLRQWCTNVMRSKVEPMKAVAQLVRRHGVAALVHEEEGAFGHFDAQVAPAVRRCGVKMGAVEISL